MTRTSRLLLTLGIASGLLLSLAPPALAGHKDHDVAVEVQSVDLNAKSITYKDGTGKVGTAPVLADAMESLKAVKAGDRVTLTCRDTDKGVHEGVVAIKRASIDKP
jgi:hypothetical protein